jgi:hypothetical protein
MVSDSNTSGTQALDTVLERTSKRVSWVWTIVFSGITLFSLGFSVGTYLTGRKLEGILIAIQENKDWHTATDTRLRSMELTLSGVQGQLTTISSVLGIMPTSEIQAIKGKASWGSK